VKSRPYGSWTRQDKTSTLSRGRRAASRTPGRDAVRARDRRRTHGSSRGLRYDRILLVTAGVALVLFSVGMVFTDVQGAGEAISTAPKSEAMKLTVPSMKRVENVPVYGDPVKEEAALHNGTLHVKDTGFPWQEEANVYIAGHRLGYPRTDSFFVFWDLNRLKMGARVLLTDSEDTRYVYKVFDRRVVGPNEVSVKKPIEGKNIVSLQTCTLPNYSERLVVRAELVKTIKAPVQQTNTG
jgi:sortase A